MLVGEVADMVLLAIPLPPCQRVFTVILLFVGYSLCSCRRFIPAEMTKIFNFRNDRETPTTKAVSLVILYARKKILFLMCFMHLVEVTVSLLTFLGHPVDMYNIYVSIDVLKWLLICEMKCEMWLAA